MLYYIIVYYILYTALYVITYDVIITIILNIKYYNNTIIYMIYNYTGYFLLLR